MQNRINGFTFLMQRNKTQQFADETAKRSLLTMKEETGSNTVVLAVMALQDTPFSEEIDYTGVHMPSDQEVESLIEYAHHIGLQVFLKPMVNCKDGTWRARIDFFDVESPCETKWSMWFENYDRYILHYAGIAERTGCELLIIGCELVQSERKEEYWRGLIKMVRSQYHGLITYNTDKYQEGHVKWWDALDMISSSGYYPIDAWKENLTRIQGIVDQYKKPFFFAECGVPCRTGASYIPNDWTYQGALNQEEQAVYYATMFRECGEFDFVQGYAGWAWDAILTDHPETDDGYNVYGKPACRVIYSHYKNNV